MKYLISTILLLSSLCLSGQHISSLQTYQKSLFSAGLSENYYLTLQSRLLHQKMQSVFCTSLFNERVQDQVYDLQFKYRNEIGIFSYGVGLGNYGNYHFSLRQYYGIIAAKIKLLKFVFLSDEFLPLLDHPQTIKNNIACMISINKRISLFTDFGKSYLTANSSNRISLGAILLDQNIQVKSQIQLYNDFHFEKMQILISFMYKFVE